MTKRRIALAVSLLAWAASAGAAELRGKVIGVAGAEIRVAVDGDLLPRPGDPVAVSFEVPGLPPVRVGTGRVVRVEGGAVLAAIAEATGTPAIDQLATIDAAAPVPRRPADSAVSPVPAPSPGAPTGAPRDLPPMPGIAGGPIPFIGTGVVPLTAERRRKLDLPDFDGGVVVRDVEPWGPGAAAGLRTDDVLRSAGGRALKSQDDLASVIRARQAGDRLRLEAWRGARPLDVTVTLADRVGTMGRACEAGTHDACIQLAWYFENGERVSKDPAVAGALLARGAAAARSACDGGDVDACVAMAELWTSGRGVAADPARALAARRQACDGGVARACLSVGLAYFEGQGVPRDEARAAGFFEKGCDGGSALACVKLGFQYERGLGVAVDLARAASLAEKACADGDSDGCGNLGALYNLGRGVPKDAERAVDLLGRACEAGNFHACKNLGWVYENGDGVGVDRERAVALYEKACQGGSSDGCGNLGLVYKKGVGVRKDRGRAKELLGRACRGGVQWACAELD